MRVSGSSWRNWTGRNCGDLFGKELAKGPVAFINALATAVAVVRESNDRRTKFLAVR